MCCDVVRVSEFITNNCIDTMALNSDYELVVSVNNTIIQDEKGNVLLQNKKGMFYIVG